MKKRALFWAGLMILMFSVSTLWAKDREYRVGCAFAITGKASWLGEPQRNTVEMLEKEINAAGGINGHRLKLFIEDTQGNNTRAVNAIKKLVKKHRVSVIIGPSRSGTSMAAIPVVTKAKVPMLSCAAAESITQPWEKRRWIFKMGQNDSDAARKICDHMTAHGIREIGILTGTTGFGAAGRTQLKKIAKEYGITIVADETYSPGDTDMTAQLISIRNAGAKAVVNWSIVPAQSIVPQNLRQLKIGIPLYQSSGFANIKYAQAAGVAAEGTIFPAGRIMAVDFIPDTHPQKAILKKYKTGYESVYKDHVSTFGGHAYDALLLVIEAMKKVGDDPAKIRDFLETTEFTGVDGIFRFSEKDHCGLDKTAFEMLTVKDGKFVVYRK
ncbi:branched-chain amino acid ABC transporter substr ate-binding protein [Desulfonema ishimotonii]|uniref:Branched-chain amino acid ABC transporter substr ate-binding protein n=1 Tax=Desulfonema ishimotonii TaxID=45657 RepID=A0A401FXI4_9BACT|nr:ABC transporter substrate-binding protein [Desulfonema ishimotonii]GBC61680.1 branched-chain amino acid ABC transporter substr ate-binding protein [Desulfonema ishimotonii]